MDIRQDTCFKVLADRIKEISGGLEIYYVKNNGNWGDRLIHEGAAQFFDDYGIPVKDIRNKDFDGLAKSPEFLEKARNAVLIVGGGGNWSKAWSGARRLTERGTKMFRRILVMPTTFELPPVNDSNVSYFARDRFESIAAVPHAEFCHDLGIYYKPAQEFRVPQVDAGWFFRTDKERSERSNIPAFNIDLSLLGTHESKIDPFFDILSNFRIINTDRLHISIAAAAIGRYCNIYPGSYFKTRAIYESSIRDYFPSITIREW